MKMKILAVLVGSMGLIVSAYAAPIVANNANVGAWTVGSGQVNGAFTTATEVQSFGNIAAPLQLGLRAQERRVGPITPDGGNSNVYTVPTGNTGTTPAPRANWNVDFSIYAPVGGLTSAQLGAFITAGHPGVSFNLRLDMNDGDPTVSRNIDLLSPTPGTGGYGGILSSFFLGANSTQQANSENLGFGYMFGGLFNPANQHWVYAKLTAQIGDNPELSVDACFHTSDASATCEGRIPLPGTVALLGLGLLGLRARRAKAVA